MTTVTQSSTEGHQTILVKFIRYLCILGTLAITAVFIYTYFTQAYPNMYDTVNTWYSPVVATIALVAIFVRALSSPKGANSRKAYFGLTLAVLFYFLGEITWSIQYVLYGGANNIPYPSISDVFWAIGTVFIIDELFFMVSVIKVRFSKKQLVALYGITVISVVALIAFVFNQVILASYSIYYTPFAKAMDLYYFVGDVLILFATLYVAFGLFSKTGFKISLKHLSFIFFILGNFSMILGDTIYSYFSLTTSNLVIHFSTFYTLTFLNGYYSTYDYSIYNLFYVFQYMFWALCFIFLPVYLSRSFSENEDIATEEFVPIETKKNMNFKVPSVSEALSDEKTAESDISNVTSTLGLSLGSQDPKPSGESSQNSKE